ncbi:MAG: amine oxidase, partial [Myxococcota bacterium]
MMKPFREITGVDGAAEAHRWRYSLVESPVGLPCLWDEAAGEGACGDWTLGARVEDAFLSG